MSRDREGERGRPREPVDIGAYPGYDAPYDPWRRGDYLARRLELSEDANLSRPEWLRDLHVTDDEAGWR